MRTSQRNENLGSKRSCSIERLFVMINAMPLKDAKSKHIRRTTTLISTTKEWA